MKMKLSRRNFLSSLAATTICAKTTHAKSDACYVTRSNVGDLPSKSYTCRLSNGRELTATFLRLSDLMFDISRSDIQLAGLPTAKQSHIIQNNSLKTFEDLHSKFSSKIDYFKPNYQYVNAFGEQFEDGVNNTLLEVDIAARTLGVWDGAWTPPTFPLPSEFLKRDWLSKTLPNGQYSRIEFIRFAKQEDFDEIPHNFKKYAKILGSSLRDRISDLGHAPSDSELMEWLSLGNLELLRYIKAGAISSFVPLFAANDPGCDSSDGIGILYDPPALFVDVAIIENTGSNRIILDDLLGEVDDQSNLRPYSNATANRLDRLNAGKTNLASGESLIIVQRLLFRSLKKILPDAGSIGAVYGPTQLPTGVLVDGVSVAFDGRSHNALVLVSELSELCCPHLDYWSEDSEEWVKTGNVLGGAEGEEKVRTDEMKFDGFIGKFRISEHEAEFSVVSEFSLDIILSDGQKITLYPQINGKPLLRGQQLRVDYLEELILTFSREPDLVDSAIIRSVLKIRGFYKKYRPQIKAGNSFESKSYSKPDVSPLSG